jgi:hypothetical protein
MSNLFDKLAAEENIFFNSQFFSPVIRGKPIRVRISGIVLNLSVSKPKNFSGWGVFTPISAKEAKFVRAPNLAEKTQYFKLFPAIRLILCRNNNNQWFGIPAHKSDTRFKVTGMVPVFLPEEVQLFETIQARFDGANCWFEEICSNADPKIPIYLRESLNKLVDPNKLELSGLSQEERDAYLIAYGPALEADIEAKRDKNEDRIKSALNRAGARYQSYIERGNTYTIEYMVEGERHRSVVRKDNLAVESAGICLSGGDKAFDLTSLIGVIKEGRRRHRIVRVGDNQGLGYDNDYGDDYDD